jgi:Na+-driven multidrug efflux pump
MRGSGDTVTPMWITLVTTVLMRIPIAYGLAYLTRNAEFPNGQPHALFISLLISWSMGALISYVVFHRGKWRRKALEVIERNR